MNIYTNLNNTHSKKGQQKQWKRNANVKQCLINNINDRKNIKLISIAMSCF